MKTKINVLIVLFVILCMNNNLIAQWQWLNPTPQGHHLNSIYFTNANTGYAVGDAGTFLKTTDAGATWTIQGGTTYFGGLFSVYFPVADTGYAVGDQGTIYKTINAGANWVKKAKPSGVGNSITSVCFTNANTGYIISVYGLYKTTDGSTSWKTITVGTTIINSVSFIDANTGYIVGFGG